MKIENVYLKCKGLSVKQIDSFIHKVYASNIKWISDNQYSSITDLPELANLKKLQYLFVTNLFKSYQSLFYRRFGDSNKDINFNKLKEYKLNNIKSKLK